MIKAVKNPFQEIGDYFKDRREQRGFSQGEVAKFLGYSSPQLVSNWERGTCNPPLNKIYLLAKLLEIEHQEILRLFTEQTRKLVSQELRPDTKSRKKLKRA